MTARLPLEPVLDLYDGNGNALARALRTPHSVVSRWKLRGLNCWAADRVAVALGHHPVDIWPDW